MSNINNLSDQSIQKELHTRLEECNIPQLNHSDTDTIIIASKINKGINNVREGTPIALVTKEVAYDINVALNNIRGLFWEFSPIHQVNNIENSFVERACIDFLEAIDFMKRCTEKYDKIYQENPMCDDYFKASIELNTSKEHLNNCSYKIGLFLKAVLFQKGVKAYNDFKNNLDKENKSKELINMKPYYGRVPKKQIINLPADTKAIARSYFNINFLKNADISNIKEYLKNNKEIRGLKFLSYFETIVGLLAYILLLFKSFFFVFSVSRHSNPASRVLVFSSCGINW